MNTLSRIYLGRDIGTCGLTVTDTQIAEWLAQIVVPSFSGFTVIGAIGAIGYWRSLRESVTILEIIHDGHAESVSLIEWISQTYAVKFSQDCVMVTTGKVELDLHSAPRG